MPYIADISLNFYNFSACRALFFFVPDLTSCSSTFGIFGLTIHAIIIPIRGLSGGRSLYQTAATPQIHIKAPNTLQLEERGFSAYFDKQSC